MRPKQERIFYLLQALLCILVCLSLAAGAVGIYARGTGEGGEGDGREEIYTREKAAAALILPGALAVLLFLHSLLKPLIAPGSVPRVGKRERISRPPEAVRPFGGRTGAVRAVLIALGAGLIVYGIADGSMRDVLVKAIHICTECIGLG